MSQMPSRRNARERFVRGNYLIDPPFQLKLMGIMLVPTFVSFAIF